MSNSKGRVVVVVTEGGNDAVKWLARGRRRLDDEELKWDRYMKIWNRIEEGDVNFILASMQSNQINILRAYYEFQKIIYKKSHF